MPEGRWLGAGPKPERYQAIVTQDLNFADTTNPDGTYSPNVWKAKSPFAAKPAAAPPSPSKSTTAWSLSAISKSARSPSNPKLSSSVVIETRPALRLTQ